MSTSTATSAVMGWLSSGNAKVQQLIADIKADNYMPSDSEPSNASWRMDDFSPGRDDAELPNKSRRDSQSVDENSRASLLKVIMDEYRHLLLHLPSGMVVVPAMHTLLEWHGSLHVKEGFYRGGVFKFVMHIPVDYPESSPNVYFFTQVSHPLVDPDTGRLDLSPAFPTWRPGRDYIVLVLSYLKKIFFKRELNGTTLSKQEFVEQCDQCVSESLRMVYVCHPNTPIAFGPWKRGNQVTSLIDGSEQQNYSDYEAIQAVMRELPAEIPVSEQAEILAEWLLNDLMLDPVEDGVVIN